MGSVLFITFLLFVLFISVLVSENLSNHTDKYTIKENKDFDSYLRKE